MYKEYVMKRLIRKALTLMLVAVLSLSYLPANVIQQSVKAADGEPTVNADVYFVSAATGKLITLNGRENDPISCDTMYNGANSVPDNGKFTIYYGDGTTDASQGKTVVNFTCKGTNTSWKADHDKVFQMGKRTNPSGWESVMMEPQGDGTVSFRSTANGKYFSLMGEELGLVEIKKGEKVSNNEKFIPYTDTKPKTPSDVKTEDVSGTSVKVTWTGVDKCIFTGYEVLYSTSQNGTYVSAGLTGSSSLEFKGLQLSTTYYVKVRAITRTDGGGFSETEPISFRTLDDYKPEKVENISVQKTSEGLSVSWDKSLGSTMYTVYRAESRFADYKEIGTVNDNKFVDKNPNKSAYKNYYKVRGKNNSDIGPFSEPASLEINMFGENMYIFADTDNVADINKITADVFENQHYNQFGKDRYTFAFKPGDYTNADVINIGYYTQILGLGKLPHDVRLRNVKVPAALSGNNATCNFWVGFENATIVDTDHNGDDFFAFQWGASQAAPARRLRVERKAVFDWWSGWASGGFVADSKFLQAAGSWSQQQYYYRNCDIAGGTYGVNWNHFVQGCEGTTVDKTEMKPLIHNNGVSNWYQRKNDTVINKTPVVREKPFLYFDTNNDTYKVFVPGLRKNSSGTSWSDESMGVGTSLSVDKCFYIANPKKDNAKTINAQLKAGKNIIFQPGVYYAEEPIEVERANTILLGLGLATIVPNNAETAISVNDVGGVEIAGLVIDAGNHSKSMIQVGREGCNKDHSENPTVLHDIFYRVGGAEHLGRTDSCLVINSNNTIVDHTWIWRADHGNNTGWSVNTAKNGMIVNGNDVTAYGLFCEHFQEYDIIWRGENGSTYFLQNEKCYDPQDQTKWMSHDGTKKGYAAYKVTDNVNNHYAVGMGVYDVFINTNGASIYLDNAIEVPNKPGVLIENATIVEIANGNGPKVGINHIVNNTTAGIRTGAGNNGGYALQKLLSYCNAESNSLPDYYSQQGSTEVQKQTGETPTIDSFAEKNITKDPSSKDDEKPIWKMTDDDYKDIKPQPSDGGTEPSGDNQDGKDSSGDGNGGDSKVDPKPIWGDDTIAVGAVITSGKYTYKITSNANNSAKVTLVGVNKKYQKKLKKVTVAAKIVYKSITFKVTAIGAKAFKKCKKVKTATIGANVKQIKSKAFADCKKLKKITVKGKALKKVAKNAFAKKVRKKLKIKAKKKAKKVLLKSLKRKK